MGLIIWDEGPGVGGMARTPRSRGIRIRWPRVPRRGGVPIRERPEPATDDPPPTSDRAETQVMDDHDKVPRRR